MNYGTGENLLSNKISHIWNTDRFLVAAVIHCRGVGSESLKTVELSKADVSLKNLFHEYVNKMSLFPPLSFICGLLDCIDFIQLPLNYYTQYITQRCTDFIVSTMTIKFNLKWVQELRISFITSEVSWGDLETDWKNKWDIQKAITRDLIFITVLIGHLKELMGCINH